MSQVSQDVSPMDESPSEPLTELLGESGDINQADSCGRTVLHTLAADGNASLLELALATCPQVRIPIFKAQHHHSYQLIIGNIFKSIDQRLPYIYISIYKYVKNRKI